MSYDNIYYRTCYRTHYWWLDCCTLHKDMSDKLMYFLLAQYVFLGLVSVFEQNFPRMLYWLGATLLTIGVLQMGVK